MCANMQTSDMNLIVFQSKADQYRVCISLCSYDFDLDPMTFILNLDIDILKMYLRSKHEAFGEGIHKSRQTDKKDARYRKHYDAAIASVNINLN